MKKKILAFSFVFILLFLFSRPVVLADERCPDYCLDGVLYSGRTYDLRTSACSSPTDRTVCEYGCDGRDKCASRPETPTEVPTRTPPTTVPPTSIPPTSIPPTTIPAIEVRPTVQISSAPRPTNNIVKKEDPACESSCKAGIKYFNGIPNAKGTCIYEKEVCEGGCSLIKKPDCNPFFQIGPAYFTDPNDNKVKPVPEALVEMKWIFLDTKTTIKPLLDRQTNLDGTISVSQSELYEYIDNLSLIHI